MTSPKFGTTRALLTSLVLLPSQFASAQSIAALSPCPIPCSWAGPDPAKWTDYHTKDALDQCNETTLFRMNLYNSIDDPETQISYRACSTVDTPTDVVSLPKRQTLSLNQTRVNRSGFPLESVSWGTKATSGVNIAASSAVSQLGIYLKSNQNLTNDAFFSRSGRFVAGVYSGAQISGDDAADIVQRFVDSLGMATLHGRQAVQLCGVRNQTIGSQIFGLIVDTNGDVGAVQSALQDWHNGTCVSGDDTTHWQMISLDLVPGTDIKVGPSADGHHVRRSELETRDTCKYVQAQSGDGCWSLAQRCGISEDQLKSFNGGASFCGSIVPGGYACCSAGSKPDFSPKPGANGSCYRYTIQTGDTCDSIAAANQMLKSNGSPDSDVIETYNKNTWAWSGCRHLLIGEYICLSSGSPPFPANLPTALCGPQVNNTAPTSDQSAWEGLNPCPLNACCNIWGQCGITPDFCNRKRGPTGAPGTAPAGDNGCISNCGTQIVASSPPATFERVGYYENFGLARPCLNMPPSQIPSHYTIVHWAFANITSDFVVDISGYKENFQQFMAMKGFKKVVAFGGWAFSTEPATYNIFRQAVTPQNRQKFVDNIVTFVKQYGVDGIDFDWEYPGEPDIPGIPPGYATEGPDYVATVELLKRSMPGGTTVSVVVPASYWYLRAFPMDKIGKVADYIIFMTYDLHGQWDYGNRWGTPGCPRGNCLRSQTNTTETVSSISMLTKAGVPLNKVVFGQPLYGRTFKMTQPDCWTEQCTYTGPESGAKHGKCTRTGGYMANWEIEQIIADPSSGAVQHFTQEAGDILVYDSTEWVSWTNPSTYRNRTEWARSLNFMGTADWAIDLNSSSSNSGDDGGSGGGIVFVDPSVYRQPNPVVQCEPPCLFVFPPWTLPAPTTIFPPPVTITVDDIVSRVTTLNGGVTSTQYVTGTTVLTISVPPVVTTEIPVWNVPWTAPDQSSVQLTTSIDLPPVVVTVPSHVIVTSGITVMAPSTVVTFNPGPYPPYSGPPVGGVPVITTVVTGQNGQQSTQSITGPFPITTVVTQSDGKSSTTTIVPIVVTKVTTNSQGKTITTATTQGLVTRTQGGQITIPPPPPPPTGSPGLIIVTSGKPTVSSTPGSEDHGTICKTNCIPEPPCVGVCGCIGICPDDCISNIFGGCGGGGGGGGRPPVGTVPTSCATTDTVSDCVVSCPARTATAATASCRTECSELEGCGFADFTTTVYGDPTGIPAPAHRGKFENPDSMTTADARDTALWQRAERSAQALLSDWFAPAAPTLVYDIYADRNCQTSQGQATLTVGGCVKPTPAWGFSAIKLNKKEGIEDGKKVDLTVFSLEKCQRNGLHYDYKNSTSELGGCVNQFGQQQTTCNLEHRDGCFVATSLSLNGVGE